MSTYDSTTGVARGLPTSNVWNVDPHYSSVDFRIVHHAVSSFRCGFEEFEASYDADADAAFTGAVSVASVRAFPHLREKLLSDEFFDALRFPEMRFSSTEIKSSGGRIAVAGELTIKEQTRPVTLEGVVLGTAPVFHFPTKTTHEHFGVDLELAIDRRDYGLTWNNALPNGMSNLGSEVSIQLALEFVGPELLS